MSYNIKQLIPAPNEMFAEYKTRNGDVEIYPVACLALVHEEKEEDEITGVIVCDGVLELCCNNGGSIISKGDSFYFNRYKL